MLTQHSKVLSKSPMQTPLSHQRQEEHRVPSATRFTRLENLGPGDPACLHQEGKTNYVTAINR